MKKNGIFVIKNTVIMRFLNYKIAKRCQSQEIAKKENITVMENGALADILDKLDIYEEIPQELYKVVANIFAFLHKLNEKAGGKKL